MQLDRVDRLQSLVPGALVIVAFGENVALVEATELKKEEVMLIEVIAVEVSVAFVVEKVTFRDMVEVTFQPVGMLVLLPYVVGGTPSSP